MLPIKYSVDRNRRPGRFFLTGSANVLALPKVADTLVGRIEIHTLWPLSQGEIRGVRESFIDTIFGDGKPNAKNSPSLPELIDLMSMGGYPDAMRREAADRRKNWFDGYITTLIERDVRDLRNIEQLTLMPKLLELIASRSGGLLNYSDIARSLEMKLTTVKTYLSLLELLFLAVPVQPWFGNFGKRLVKSPKVYLNDTGLLCHLLGRDARAMARDGTFLGMVYENFVLMELMKQISWSRTSRDSTTFALRAEMRWILCWKRAIAVLSELSARLILWRVVPQKDYRDFEGTNRRQVPSWNRTLRGIAHHRH